MRRSNLHLERTMQLHEQINAKKSAYAHSKPRSTRRVEVHREHVKLMCKQLKREIRKDKRK